MSFKRRSNNTELKCNTRRVSFSHYIQVCGDENSTVINESDELSDNLNSGFVSFNQVSQLSSPNICDVSMVISPISTEHQKDDNNNEKFNVGDRLSATSIVDVDMEGTIVENMCQNTDPVVELDVKSKSVQEEMDIVTLSMDMSVTIDSNFKDLPEEHKQSDEHLTNQNRDNGSNNFHTISMVVDEEGNNSCLELLNTQSLDKSASDHTQNKLDVTNLINSTCTSNSVQVLDDRLNMPLELLDSTLKIDTNVCKTINTPPDIKLERSKLLTTPLDNYSLTCTMTSNRKHVTNTDNVKKRIMWSLPPLKRKIAEDNDENYTNVSLLKSVGFKTRKIAYQSVAETPMRQPLSVCGNQDLSAFSPRQSKMKNTLTTLRCSDTPFLASDANEFRSHVESLPRELPTSWMKNVMDYNFGRLQRFLKENCAQNIDLYKPHSNLFLTDLVALRTKDLTELENKLHFPICELLINRRKVVEEFNQRRFKSYIRMYFDRILSILLSSDPSGNLKCTEFNYLERLQFSTGAHRTLYQCQKAAERELKEIEVQNMLDRNLEVDLEIEYLEKVFSYLESWEEHLTKELKKYDQEKEKFLEVQFYAKESLKKSKQIELEIEASSKQLKELQLSNENLTYELNVLECESKCIGLDKIAKFHRYALCQEIGDSDLFSPIERLLNCKLDVQFTDDYVCQQITNLFSYCYLKCVSLTKVGQKLVNNGQLFANPEGLMVSSFDVRMCKSDENYSVDCPPVHDVARICIEFFNSLHGFQSLHSRLVGINLKMAIQHVETVLTPYLVLASDLRAIWLKKHELRLTPKCPITLSPFTPKPTCFKMLEQTPYSIRQYMSTQKRIKIGLKTSSLDLDTKLSSIALSAFQNLVPSDPISIDIKLFHPVAKTVVLLHIVLSSMELLENNGITVNIESVYGKIRLEVLEAYLQEECKPKIGALYHTVNKLMSFISSQ